MVQVDQKYTEICNVFVYYNFFVCTKHKKAVRSGCIPVEQCWPVQETQTDTNDDREIPAVERTTRTRHKQVILSFLGVTVFGLQISSLSLGLVAMSDANDSSGYAIKNYTLGQKGIMSGMMGYGNSLGNVMLGMMAHRFHVMNILPLASGLFSGTMAFVIPLAALHFGFEAACLAVLLQGLGLSFVYPCVYVHLSKWVVPHEQAKFSWVWSGHQVGHLIVMLTSGALYASPGGWPSVFYVPGIVGIIWGFAFLTWGVRSPAHHQTISPSEKEFIERHLKPKIKDRSGNEIVLRGSRTHDEVPWRSITKSVPMWALLIVQLSDLWVGECMMGPIFLHSVCRLSVMKVGLMTGVAYIANIMAGVLFACLAHRITDRVGLNFSRKFWTAIGLYGGSLSLLLLTIVGRHCYIATLFLESRIVINAATHPGYMSTILNVAPNLAATIASAFNAITSFLASTGPFYTGLIVKDEYNLIEWDIVFCTSIAVYIVGCTTFIIFGSTEAQDWDAPHVTTELGRMSPSSFDELPLKPRKPEAIKMKMIGKLKFLQKLNRSSVELKAGV
uniref:Putative inorganic phosphate cotransporter n=1 Tax=Lygus hesperus TaxID=30085 RepID=A0A0A9WAV6_LYGHE